MSSSFVYNRIIPFIVSLALFMEAVDSTVINTAIPTMATSLHVNPIDLKVGLISYLLSLAIFIPVSGWMADKYGIKRMFIIALVVFTLSSLLCGYSNNLTTLVSTRFLQGLGGAFMLPLGRLIIVRNYPRRELVTIMSRVVVIGALGMMLGPALGGVITNHLSWRWIFWINIPVGLLNIILALVWLKESSTKDLHRLDKIGFILFGAGLAGLTFSLSAFSESTIEKYLSINIFVISLLLLFLYSLRSRRQRHPIVNMKLFTLKTFRIAIIGNFFSRLAFSGIPFLIPLLLQICLGYSPQTSGLLLAPTAIGVVIIKPMSLHILRTLGYKPLLLINTVLMAISVWTFTFINNHTPLIFIGFLTFIYGFLSALQYTGMNSLAYAEIDPPHLSSATSIMSTLQQVSQSFGVAICAILIQIFSASLFEPGVVTIKALHHTLIAMAILTILSIMVFTRLKPNDGIEMIS